MDKVISESKYSRKQHKDFYMFHMFHRGTTIILLVVVMIAMLALAIMNTVNAKEDSSSTIIFSWIMCAVSFSFIPIMMISKINNVIKQETPDRLKSTDRIEVTKIKITRTTDVTNGKAVIGWNNIALICETDKYFYIYLSEQNGIFIVKEDIKEGSVELFRKLALANLSKDKKGRPLYKRYGEAKKAYNLEKRMLKDRNKQNDK